MIESTKGFPKLLAKISGFDGSYIRFSGSVSLEIYDDSTLIEHAEDDAIWELMYFGKNLD